MSNPVKCIRRVGWFIDRSESTAFGNAVADMRGALAALRARDVDHPAARLESALAWLDKFQVTHVYIEAPIVTEVEVVGEPSVCIAGEPTVEGKPCGDPDCICHPMGIAEAMKG